MIPSNTNFSKATLADLLAYIKDDVMIDVNCHAIGTIQTFNSTLQTATASINYQKVVYLDGANPTLASYPVLVDCPVKYPFGGNGGMTFPYIKGDQVVIGFNDRDFDTWFAGTTNQAPTTARLHSFTDAIIFGGIKQPGKPIPNFDATRPMLRNADGTAYTAVDPSTGKTQIKNGSNNLETILQSILTHVQGLANASALITVTGSFGTSSPPVNAATFTTLSSELSTDATNLAEVLQ